MIGWSPAEVKQMTVGTVSSCAVVGTFLDNVNYTFVDKFGELLFNTQRMARS